MRPEIAHADFDTPVIQEWLQTRPPRVLELAREFPLGMRLYVGNVTYVVVGYVESASKGWLVRGARGDKLAFATDGTPAYDLEDTLLFFVDKLREGKRVITHEGGEPA